MATEAPKVQVAVLAFGQVAERLGGRRHQIEVDRGITIEALVKTLGLDEWIAFGLSVALDGERCHMDTALDEECEVALLPPVSGG
ncbi:MAG: MoaD/ThiS family protein [Candidatus Poseidonia sp.]|nr:MoaD/ThiS family protein [Poseidonia sp.]